MVEPLPLVPATWITGGSLRSGWPSAAEQALHAIERQIDALGMQREQPRDDGIDLIHDNTFVITGRSPVIPIYRTSHLAKRDAGS